jgi:von Willebrand factor type A domain
MPPALSEQILARETSLWTTLQELWETRPRSQGVRAQCAWLLLVIKQLCRRNLDWLISAGIHTVILLAIGMTAWSASKRSTTVQFESALGVNLAETDFESVFPGDGNMGGGGTPSEKLEDQLPPTFDAIFDAQPRDFVNKGFAPLIGGTGDSTGRGDGGEGGGRGGGTGTGVGPGIGAGFFGTTGAGNSFVYIVDMSGSMHGTRFERAKKELIRSIKKLGPEQKFYVYFFNDRTYGLFDPKPAAGMIPANNTNKDRAKRWIDTRQAESTTNPNYALQLALEMRPDVIFLLTDGELDEPEAIRQMIRKTNRYNVVIHTIAFENEDGGVTLKTIAEENSGTYRFVR